MKTLLMKSALLGLLVMNIHTASANKIMRINPEGVVDTSIFGFTQAVIVPTKGHYVYISGQAGWNPDGLLAGESMQAQMAAAYRNLKTIMTATNAKPEHIVKIRMLIVDHKEEYLKPLHSENQKLFAGNLPASTLIPVPRLALDGMLFEIEATLFIPVR